MVSNAVFLSLLAPQALVAVSPAHASSSLSQQLAAHELILGSPGLLLGPFGLLSVAQQDDLSWAPDADVDAQQLPLDG